MKHSEYWYLLSKVFDPASAFAFPKKKVVGIGIVVRLKMPPFAKNMYNCLISMSLIILSCLNCPNCFLSLKSKLEKKIVFDDVFITFFKIKVHFKHLDPEQDSYTGMVRTQIQQLQ
jgi:hypothetical protein